MVLPLDPAGSTGILNNPGLHPNSCFVLDFSNSRNSPEVNGAHGGPRPWSAAWPLYLRGLHGHGATSQSLRSMETLEAAILVVIFPSLRSEFPGHTQPSAALQCWLGCPKPCPDLGVEGALQILLKAGLGWCWYGILGSPVHPGGERPVGRAAEPNIGQVNRNHKCGNFWKVALLGLHCGYPQHSCSQLLIVPYLEYRP